MAKKTKEEVKKNGWPEYSYYVIKSIETLVEKVEIIDNKADQRNLETQKEIVKLKTKE